MRELIVITHPGQVYDETDICKELLNEGLQRLHVRKPNWDDAKLNGWLSRFSEAELKKMVIHHNRNAFEKFNAGGLHVSYSAELPVVKNGSLSCSVHNWDEASDAIEKCDYVFISPLFDSISKSAYKKNPDLIIIPQNLSGRRIIALGGIDENTIEEVFDIGYSGAAVLGYIWNNPESAVINFNKLNNLIHA